jgi:hypothetical protein
MDKSKLKDGRGRPLTQSLFLEVGYNTEYAVYTQKDDDYDYKGKLYPSLKKLYLEHEDPTEYDFASTYLLGWQHWQRIVRNKVLCKMVEEWREELELKLRSQAVRQIRDLSYEDKGFQAAKWIADKGWDKRAAGRPSNADIERETKMQANINEEYNADVVRLING